jgi:uroporphyrinogen-III synthase
MRDSMLRGLMFWCLCGALFLPPAVADQHGAGAPERESSLIARRDLPLYGKTVLYTTPRNYAGKLGRLLIERGARPVWMPTIYIEPVPDYRVFDEVLRERDRYNWIAFTSRNGIDAYLDRMAALDLTPADMIGLKAAAVGNDATALKKAGIIPVLVPPKPSPIGIVNEMKRRGITGGTVLVPAPDVIGMDEPLVVPEFIADLQAIGLETKRVPAYVTARETEDLELGTELLLDGKIDMIAFTSRGEIESLLLHLGDDREVLNENTVLACFGPITSKGAELRNLKVDVVARDYSRFEGFVAAMEDYYRGQ